MLALLARSGSLAGSLGVSAAASLYRVLQWASAVFVPFGRVGITYTHFHFSLCGHQWVTLSSLFMSNPVSIASGPGWELFSRPDFSPPRWGFTLRGGRVVWAYSLASARARLAQALGSEVILPGEPLPQVAECGPLGISAGLSDQVAEEFFSIYWD